MSPRFYCPVCKRREDHQILSESHDLLVQCTQCSHIHHMPRPKPPAVLVIRTIVSHEKKSIAGTTELLSDDVCRVGDYIVAECGDESVGVEITGIEKSDTHKRVSKAQASDIETLWTRSIERVVLKASVHDGRLTLPIYHICDGEEVFVVGEVYAFGGKRFRTSHIKLRDGAVLRKEGWKTTAQRIKRIYGNRL